MHPDREINIVSLTNIISFLFAILYRLLCAISFIYFRKDDR